MTVDISECGGVRGRIAGKLENLLCVMARTLCLRISFPTFWHFPAWTTNSKFQRRETKEFTWQDKRLTRNSLSTFDSQIYVAFLTLRDTLSSHSTELQNLITGGTDRESISWSHMRFKSLPQQYSRCTVIQCRDVKTRAKVKHTHTHSHTHKAVSIYSDAMVIYIVAEQAIALTLTSTCRIFQKPR